ncbi:MAG: lipocalin-like domain-containing protein [Elusimicrobia bacterium]|nr:lipocalin-like domain-containing protein [Elusimicrobiota bacterium]
MVGTWRLKSVDVVDSPREGDVRPWGRRPEGLLSYTPDGYMFVAINGGDESGPGLSRELRDMLFYAGRWELGEKGALAHVILHSADVDRIGVRLERTARVSGKTLTIVGRGRAGHMVRLVWKKAA